MARGDRLRRWGTTVLVALLVCAGCVAAGIWQWDRHEQRSQAVARVEANHGAEPRPLDELVDDDVLDQAVEWRPASVSGRWVGEQVLLRNRPVDGRNAFHVLAVLEVTDGPLAGNALVVDRGWLPAGDGGTNRVEAPPRPDDEVDVVVRLRPAEPAADRAAPAGQVQAIAPDQVVAAAEAPEAVALLGLYGVLATEDGAPAPGVGTIPRPPTDLGSHLSYTFQWWLFAIGSLVGAGVLIRRDVVAEAEVAAESDAAGPEPGRAGDATRPSSARRRRRPSAEEEEDALLDQQAAARP